jgi:hypothetical protein
MLLGLGFFHKIKAPLYTRTSKPMTIQIENLSLEEKTHQQGTRRVRFYTKVEDLRRYQGNVNG